MIVVVTEDIQDQLGEEFGNYEVTIVVRPDATDEEVATAAESVSQYITERGGVIGEVEQWGKRRLAYPIKRGGEGHYILTRFQMRPEHNRELEANLRISEDVIRHLLVKLA